MSRSRMGNFFGKLVLRKILFFLLDGVAATIRQIGGKVRTKDEFV